MDLIEKMGKIPDSTHDKNAEYLLIFQGNNHLTHSIV